MKIERKREILWKVKKWRVGKLEIRLSDDAARRLVVKF